jgi:type III restriction enzyme
MAQEIPIQPVENPILCNPWDEPNVHWVYNPKTGVPTKQESRRLAGYWYRTERTGTAQLSLLAEEERDDLPLINALRDDVRRWRESGYRGASHVTRELLQYWARTDRHRRLFFCQREAVETIIYLAELRFPNRSSRTGFQRFAVSDDNLRNLLVGERPSGALGGTPEFFPKLIDRAADENLIPLRRLGCKMATGSGKTVVMAMLIAWAFCNRGVNRESREFPNAVLVCCPNLTVKERLQVLRPEHRGNYYAEFDIVPPKYRPLLQNGKVLVTNWHGFAPESEHKEGERTYAVVNKGPETPDVFVQRVLGKDVAERLPILVLNDEGHHCWRPKASTEDSEGLTAEERQSLKDEAEEARVWLDGLDRINNCGLTGTGKPAIALAVDLSATPFYIKGSNHPEGQPFPWLVSDFGLVDAIESGIVKIPRLPVLDTTGRPDPKYFRLWERIREDLQPGEFLPGRARKPKPEAIWREAEDALRQMVGQWSQRFELAQAAKPGQEVVPPVLIVVCDNTDIAEVFFRNISGQREEETITEEEVEEVLSDNGDDESEAEETETRGRSRKPKKRISYGPSLILDKFANTPTRKYTVRIDTKLLAEAESEDPRKRKADAAEALRKIVATVGKPNEPGERVRCVVSVAMLTEGWDANNVTQVLGIRAFGSQLLCEQVVGRGLRRMDYSNFDEQGRFKPEYVDVYGIPFSVIPFKGRPVKHKEDEDKPVNHVRALPERAQVMEMRFPVVEGYVFALKKNLIRCDVSQMEVTTIEPDRTPTATFVSPAVGYRTGHASQGGGFGFDQQNRDAYYASTHLQTIQFALAQRIVAALAEYPADGSDKQRRVLRLQSRHQLFPQVYRYVEDYVGRRVDFRDENSCELGLEKYVKRIEGLFLAAVTPDETQGESPLLPLLNRIAPIGSTADVAFNTTRACYVTQFSHINMVVGDTATWEQSAAFRLEMAARKNMVRCYARNDGLGLTIPYEWYNVDRSYEPDYLVSMAPNATEAPALTVVLEIKGMLTEEDKAKHEAARRWIAAVNNWGKLGRWAFHVCRDPQLLDRELSFLLDEHKRVA